MRANRGKDTGPEVALRKVLFRRGYRFRKNLRLDLGPGLRARPDIAFTRPKVAVFVDGCYWHGCKEHRSIPASNREFWLRKIDATRQRDIAQAEWLEAAGWTVIRVWEHECVDEAADRVAETVRRMSEGRTH
jgi:DNA mismatch endonuclease (patch repair protein)